MLQILFITKVFFIQLIIVVVIYIVKHLWFRVLKFYTATFAPSIY